MCEFCDGKARPSEFFYGEGATTVKMMVQELFGVDRENEDDDCIFIKDGNKLVYDNSSGEYCQQGIEINYCPICGKQLTKESDE